MHRGGMCGGGNGRAGVNRVGGTQRESGVHKGGVGVGGRHAPLFGRGALRGPQGVTPRGSHSSPLPPRPRRSLVTLRGCSARQVRQSVPGLQRATALPLCQCPVIKMSPFNFQASRSNLFLIKSLIETLLHPRLPGKGHRRGREGAEDR